MRSRLLISIATGLLVGVSWGQEQSAVQPPTTTPAPASTDASKPKKPKAKRVFTNEDIPERPADTSSSGTAASGSSEAAANSGVDPKNSKGKDAKAAAKASQPKGSAEEIEAAQKKIDGLKKEEDGIKTGLSTYEKWSKSDDPARRKAMSEAMQVYQNDLSESQKKREAAEKELENLKAPK